MADDTQQTGGTGEATGSQAAQDDRLAKLEATQAEQGGKIDQILNLIKGGDGGAAPAEAGNGPAEESTIADQVRQAVRDVRAEEAQAEADAKHKADHEAIREKPPRESQSGFRGRLQKAMYGGDPT